MALMLLYAAGEYSLESKENAISHVVSSYASMLKALQLINPRSPASLLNPGSNHTILIVAMPATPGP